MLGKVLNTVYQLMILQVLYHVIVYLQDNLSSMHTTVNSLVTEGWLV